MTVPVLSLVPAGLVVAGLLLGALRHRGRLAALHTLPPADGPVDVAAYRTVTAAGVVVDDATVAAAVAHARREGLAAVDLVPRDLPVGEAYTLARRVDPARYRADRMAAGRGAGHAIVAEAALLERAGITGAAGVDPAVFLRLTDRVKKYAPTGVDLAVAPGLRAVPADPATRKARLRALSGVVPVVLAGPVLGYAVLAAAVVARPAYGWLALVAYSLQPYLVLAGAPLRPRDRHRGAWLRLLREPLRWLREVRGDRRSEYDAARAQRLAEARERYAADLALGTDRFFEPRRDTCPWCGDGRLSVLVDTPDRTQGKPGRFHLEECAGCKHVFQNPRLNLEGLEFYYRDAYDGLGEGGTERVFAMSTRSYRGRAAVVRRFGTPRTWLDVGTGHGHFCTYARSVFPDTVFDGLDISDAIDEAQRRGWVANGYRGLFPEFAEKLADSYDVVSMHHYLEHTRDPREELDAAARVVAPGGYVLIEVPDPRSRFGRLLGSYWMPWFQPEHLNLVPLDNLRPALAERGLEVVSVERGRAHQPCDFLVAVLLWFNSVLPDPDRAWAPRPATRAQRVVHGLAFAALLPVMLVGLVVDQTLAVVLAPTQGGNCYRVLARKPGRAA